MKEKISNKALHQEVCVWVPASLRFISLQCREYLLISSFDSSINTFLSFLLTLAHCITSFDSSQLGITMHVDLGWGRHSAGLGFSTTASALTLFIQGGRGRICLFWKTWLTTGFSRSMSCGPVKCFQVCVCQQLWQTLPDILVYYG